MEHDKELITRKDFHFIFSYSVPMQKQYVGASHKKCFSVGQGSLDNKVPTYLLLILTSSRSLKLSMVSKICMKRILCFSPGNLTFF
jgi:hypothetical protein